MEPIDPARLAVRRPDGSIPTYARERRQLLRAWHAGAPALVTFRGRSVEPYDVDWSKLVKDSGSSGARGDGKTKVVSISLRPAVLERLDAHAAYAGLNRSEAVAAWVATLPALDTLPDGGSEHHGESKRDEGSTQGSGS